MSKECARSLRKGCGGHAAGPAAHIDEHRVVDSRSERMLMRLLRVVPVWVRAYQRPLVSNHLFTARPAPTGKSKFLCGASPKVFAPLDFITVSALSRRD